MIHPRSPWCPWHFNIVRNSRRTTRWINGEQATNILLDRFIPADGIPQGNIILWLREIYEQFPLCCKVPEDELACILDQCATEGDEPWLHSPKLPTRNI